jgi:IS30 family transposase
MGAKHTTERERELFQQLISTGMSVRKISRLTGRSHDTVSNYVNSDVAQHTLPTATTEEEMYKVFDLHHAGKRTIDIAIEMNRPPSTIRMIVKRLYQKHENAYQRWIEMQTQKESPALVMEVQTVQPQRQDEPEQPGIDWQAKWCEAQQQIAELREINSILKAYVRHLQILNEQQDRISPV